MLSNISKYVSKEEQEEIRPEIKNALEKCKNCSTNDLASKLLSATNKIMKFRERSAQEAAFLVSGLKLRGSSRSVVFINTKLIFYN